MTAGPSVTITKADLDATTGDLNLAWTATYDQGGGVTQVVPMSRLVPAYQVAWCLALVKQIVLPSQYIVPNSAAPTDADVARLAAIALAIFECPVEPPTPAPTALTPPPFTLLVS